MGIIVFFGMVKRMRRALSRGEWGEEMDEVLGVKPGISACSVVYVFGGGSC